MMEEVSYASIDEILSRVRRREIRPVELVEAQLARIAKSRAALNAFVHLDEEGARKKANEIATRMAHGEKVGPLAGLPITVKSCVEVAGWPNPAGSLLREKEIPGKTAPLVQRLAAAGAIPLGNTNTPEFLMAYETANRLNGKTANPWKIEYSSGGSSGGEAAAIAAGLSFGGIGSDGGGSIRVPAHFCGICGLKPTPGRIPTTGHFPPGTASFGWLGVVGPMARTVRDIRALFRVIQGADSGDALSVSVPMRTITSASMKGLRIGILESDELKAATNETKDAVDSAARLLEAQGFVVEPFRLDGLGRALELWWFFFGTVIGELLGSAVKGKERLLSDQFLEYLQVARREGPTTMEEFVGKSAARDHERARILEAMADCPLLLSPVSSGPAFRHGEGNWRAGSGYRETMRHSQWLNLCGFPGLVLPMRNSSEGLPIGVQLIGRPFEEELLLAAGERLEEARGKWPAPGAGQ